MSCTLCTHSGVTNQEEQSHVATSCIYSVVQFQIILQFFFFLIAALRNSPWQSPPTLLVCSSSLFLGFCHLIQSCGFKYPSPEFHLNIHHLLTFFFFFPEVESQQVIQDGLELGPFASASQPAGITCMQSLCLASLHCLLIHHHIFTSRLRKFNLSKTKLRKSTHQNLFFNWATSHNSSTSEEAGGPEFKDNFTSSRSYLRSGLLSHTFDPST